MTHNIKAKLSGLRYKGIITDKDYQRLCKALDIEKVLDKIRAEIAELQKEYKEYGWAYDDALEIIDKYKAESEEI